jgi:hypothetical protein
VAYNPTAGAVFGVELIRMGHLTIVADDGSSPQILLPNENDWSDGPTHNAVANGDARSAALKIAHRVGEVPLTETARGRPGTNEPVVTRSRLASSPEIMTVNPTPPPTTVSGEIRARAGSPRDFGRPVVDQPPPPFGGAASRGQGAVVEVPQSTDDITQPGVNSPLPGAMRGASGTGQLRPEPPPAASFGVGLSPIGGSSAISGEIVPRVPPGARVLVPGPNGLMQSATVRQLLQGYYELEVGSSGETIWVPTNGVVPEH